MALPNTNTNNNLTCSDETSFQGLIFDGSNINPTMSIINGASTLISLSLKDVFMTVDQWVSRDFNVKAESSMYIDGDNIQDEFGEVQFIAIIVSYPQADVNKVIVPATDQYIQFEYPQFGASTYSIGKIMMLSGSSNPGSGWGFNESPGGITLINPHTNFDVRVKLLAFN